MGSIALSARYALADNAALGHATGCRARHQSDNLATYLVTVVFIEDFDERIASCQVGALDAHSPPIAENPTTDADTTNALINTTGP